jgi:hypothetical protein
MHAAGALDTPAGRPLFARWLAEGRRRWPDRSLWPVLDALARTRRGEPADTRPVLDEIAATGATADIRLAVVELLVWPGLRALARGERPAASRPPVHPVVTDPEMRRLLERLAAGDAAEVSRIAERLFDRNPGFLIWAIAMAEAARHAPDRARAEAMARRLRVAVRYRAHGLWALRAFDALGQL